MPKYKGENIILFDGLCNLCNNSVNFIIDRDYSNYYKFASLQSEVGLGLMADQKDQIPENIDSIILFENRKVYTKSTAALKIAKKLKGFCSILYVFMIIPYPIRDFIYDIIAKNRYKWFKKESSCKISTIELRSKFLE